MIWEIVNSAQAEIDLSGTSRRTKREIIAMLDSGDIEEDMLMDAEKWPISDIINRSCNALR